MAAAHEAPETREYGRAAGLLTLALGSAGLLTYAFFALASHNLSREDYGEVVVLWSAVFITVSTLFRPVEQLLSRTLAELEVRRTHRRHALRVASAIQLALATGFVVVAVALREPLEQELLSGSSTLYAVLLTAVVAFGGAFFLRGMLAGSRRFGLYAVLLLLESSSRLAFALAVAIGIAEGRDAVAIGIAVSPALSMLVVPLALVLRRRNGRRPAPRPAAAAPTPPAIAAEAEFTLAHGGGFAAAVLLIMLSEQVMMNSGALFVRAAEGTAAAGFIFNVLMVARAPLLLFQAIAASLLPHLARLRARGGAAESSAFEHSVRLTLLAIAGFAAAAVIVLLAGGPELMQIAFGDKFEYPRADLVIVAVGMGLYLSGATLNQAALAQGQARRAAGCWAVAAVAFVVWNLVPVLDHTERVETGFAGAAGILCALLYALYRNPRPRAEDEVRPDSPEEIELRLAAADEAS